MSDITARLGYAEPQAGPRPALRTHGSAMSQVGEAEMPALLPTEQIGQQRQEPAHFRRGLAEARPGGDVPTMGEAEGGEAGEGLAALAALF